jgi:hypothetical protein
MKASRFAIPLAVVLLAGCGGGGGGNRLSHSEFVKRADALCKTAVTQAKAVPKPQSLSELPRYLDRIRPIQARFLADARKLRAPVRDESVWQRALAFDQRVLKQYKLLAAAARRRDVRSARRISDALAALPERNPYERRLGMKGC